MAIKLEDLNVVAEDGTKVTGDMVRAWERAYCQGRIPNGYHAVIEHNEDGLPSRRRQQ